MPPSTSETGRVQPAEDRVVLQQVGLGVVVAEVVERHDLDVGAGGEQRRGRSCGRSDQSR